MHCIGLAGNRISQPAKKIPSARVSGSKILIVSSYTWRQVVKLVVIVKSLSNSGCHCGSLVGGHGSWGPLCSKDILSLGKGD